MTGCPLEKRGQVLVVFAWIALTLGALTWLRLPTVPVEGVVHTHLPPVVEVGKWVVAAAIAATAAFTRRYRLGYAALVGVVAFRGASLAAGWVVWVMSEGAAGTPTGWAQALEYAGFAVLLIILAGPDDGTVRAVEHPTPGGVADAA
ncbi:hypothetical protein [Pseudactinotalea sp. Z1732]|uniref:hypothetical protein n=1 Tax=Micrococcales TaxID=85006 RepID=UPI003C7DAD2C